MSRKLDKFDLEAEREGKALSKSLRLKVRSKKKANLGRGEYIITTKVLNRLKVR